MARVVVVNHVTLDGVMQGPGRPDEDTRDGFDGGGWATARSDDVVGTEFGKWMGGGRHAFLLGHRSYHDMLSTWNERGGPYRDGLNATPKYVASRSAATQLDWPNSTLLTGDVPAAVAELKTTTEDDLVIMGSGELLAALMEASLIDVFVLAIHPLVLGRGRRLFADGAQVDLRLAASTANPHDVVVATYELADDVGSASGRSLEG